MPKRSTAFQRLIAKIESQINSGDFEVTESKMLKDKITGNEREVDIVIEGKQGAHNFTTSIECTERTRKAGTNWVEEMKTKHAALSTNKLILVSKSGFNSPAKTKAKHYDIETLTLEQAKKENWNRKIFELSAMDFEAFVEPYLTEIQVTLDGEKYKPEEVNALEKQFGDFSQVEIYQDDRRIGSVLDYAHSLIRDNSLADFSVEKLAEGHQDMKLRLTVTSTELEYKINGEQELFVEKIEVFGMAHREHPHTKLKKSKYADVSLVFGEMKGERFSVNVLGTQMDKDHNPVISIEVTPKKLD